jgi:hypothetical protein
MDMAETKTKAKAKPKAKKTENPEVEINAKWSGNEFWKEWGKDSECKCGCSGKHGGDKGNSGMIMFVGFIGSLVYWMQAAAGFGAVVTGFLKSLVWPAYLVYKLLENFYGVVN